MNKDRVEGKVKDIAGRVQRQAGEWADDPEAQVKGAAKQAEGKVQHAWGQTKDAVKDADKESKRPQSTADERDSARADEDAARRRG